MTAQGRWGPPRMRLRPSARSSSRLASCVFEWSLASNSPDIGKMLEERGYSQRGFDVVDVFHAARQIGLEHMVSDVQVQGQPVGDEQPIADAEIDRELVLFSKFHIAHAHRHIQCRIEGMPTAEEYLPRQHVVAQVDVVIREASPSVAEHRDIRENILKTRGAGLRAGQKTLQKYAFRHLVAPPPPLVLT